MEIGVAALSAGSDHTVLVHGDGQVSVWTPLNAEYGQDLAPKAPPGLRYAQVTSYLSGSVASWHPDSCSGYAVEDCLPAQPNSSFWQGSKLEAHGCPSLSKNEFVLRAQMVPQDKLCLLLYGAPALPLPFGSGLMCLSAPIQRVYPAVQASHDYSILWKLDLNEFPFSSGPGQVTAGSTWNFQVWHRDESPINHNLSSAVQVQFGL